MFASLRSYRNYRLYFAGQITSYTGSQVAETALFWLVLERTGSSISLGALVLCHYGPFALLGLWGGVIADRFDNRRILIGTQTAGMTIALLLILAYVTSAPLAAFYALALGSGVQLAVDNPSKYGLIYRLVSRREVSNAISLNATLQNVARIVGPALGGVVIATSGVGWCLALNAVSYVAALSGLLLMTKTQLIPIDRPSEAASAVKDVKEGFAHISHSPELQALIGMALAFGVLGFSAVKTLLSILATQTLESGPRTFGLLAASYGIGAVLGGLANAAFVGVSWRRLFVGALGFSLGMLLLAPARSIIVACLLLTLIGGAWTTWTSSAQSIAVLEAPDQLRGRVMSLFIGSLLLGVIGGGPLSGWLAARGGTTLAFAICGAGGIAATGAAALSLRANRRRSADPGKVSIRAIR